MGHHHHLQFPPPSDSLLLADWRTQSTFEQIPVMSVGCDPTHFISVTDRGAETNGSDLSDASSSDPLVRRALADRIRDACINVSNVAILQCKLYDFDVVSLLGWIFLWYVVVSCSLP